MTRSALVGVRRALQASAGRARVKGRQRWDRLLVPRKKTPGSRWRRSEGSLDRQPAKDRVALAGNVSNVPNRVPLFHRSSVCAVKRPPTRAAACLNRTRRRESIDSLVLVVGCRLSEFERTRLSHSLAGRKARRWVRIARLGRPTTPKDGGDCIESGDKGVRCLQRSDSNRYTEHVASALPRVEGRFRTEGGPDSRVSPL